MEEHLSSAVRTLAAVVALRDVPESERRRQLLLLKEASEVANTSSLVGEDELTWKTSVGIRVSVTLLWHLARALPRELAHTLERFRGRCDVAIAKPQLLSAPPVPLGMPTMHGHPAND